MDGRRLRDKRQDEDTYVVFDVDIAAQLNETASNVKVVLDNAMQHGVMERCFAFLQATNASVLAST